MLLSSRHSGDLAAVEDPVAAIPLGVSPNALKVTESQGQRLNQSVADKRGGPTDPDLPAAGSVMAMAPMHLPAVISGMKRSTCSLLPYLLMYGMVMSECTAKNGPVQLAYILSDRNRSDVSKSSCGRSSAPFRSTHCSSHMIAAENTSPPIPPCSSGIRIPSRPCEPAFSHNSLLTFPAFSHLEQDRKMSWKHQILVIVV